MVNGAGGGFVLRDSPRFRAIQLLLHQDLQCSCRLALFPHFSVCNVSSANLRQPTIGFVSQNPRLARAAGEPIGFVSQDSRPAPRYRGRLASFRSPSPHLRVRSPVRIARLWIAPDSLRARVPPVDDVSRKSLEVVSEFRLFSQIISGPPVPTQPSAWRGLETRECQWSTSGLGCRRAVL